MKIKQILTFVALALLGLNSQAKDGYELWLDYQPLEQSYAPSVQKTFQALVAGDSTSMTRKAAINELQRGFSGLTGRALKTTTKPVNGGLVLALADELRGYGVELPEAQISELGDEGYRILRTKARKKTVTLIVAKQEQGLLYGSFALLQHLMRQQPLSELQLQSSPSVKLRVLNHWDNLDGSVERGYAGASLWDWWRLPEIVDPRYLDYARANAAIGINGAVLNNVNAQALSLSPRYLAKTAAIAEVLRPYGIKVYLSARFSAPIELGGLLSADPRDPDVQKWWREKATEIYGFIPDFGGFLVKANSEGQPGPGDYGRTHAEGANLLAEALAPHGGIVMWRAFVYSELDAEDRAKQAYSEFKPLDGKFADNVLVQVKNGPIDFQPREPFHPLFGDMPKTPLMMELQITKEYLGFSSHLAYLAPLYQEVFEADTYRPSTGSTVSRVIDGSNHNHTLTGIAGVANIGRDRNWSGSIFDQANWFAFGRMAWNPDADARDIAQEWLGLTFSNHSEFIETASAMMMGSREAVVDYMTPLGLAHLMATGHHYGPAPWVSDLARPEWNPAYYHQADAQGIGFDRTKSGSNALAQYAPQLAAEFADLERIDERLLLWFHHLPWDYRLNSGKTLWEGLAAHYDRGVAQVERMREQWQTLEPYIDAERFATVATRLEVQLKEALWWRDASLAYFSEVSGRALPEGVRKPTHSLRHYQALEFPFAPGDGG